MPAAREVVNQSTIHLVSSDFNYCESDHYIDSSYHGDDHGWRTKWYANHSFSV